MSVPLPRHVRFDTLSTYQGLASSSVSRIEQDSQGFLWFATQAGLNRYDGYSFTLFEHNPFDQNSLTHNLIQTMFIDKDGIIWLGTYGGLNRFDPDTGSFTAYENDPDDPRSLSHNVVVAITRDASGSLWAGTMDGLNRLDEASGKFDRYVPGKDTPGALPDKVVRSLLTDGSGNLWVGTYAGLCRYEPELDTFAVYPVDPDNPDALPSPYTMTMINDKRDSRYIWVGTWGGGITRLDKETGKGTTYKLPADQVYQLLMDSHGRIWIGTWGGGLIIFDPESGKTLHITDSSPGHGDGLVHNVVYSLFEDASGIVWVGTNGGGINKYVEWKNQYEFLIHNESDSGSLPAGKVESIWQDDDGTLWVGVYSGGLHRYNEDTGGFRHYRYSADNPSTLSNDIVNVIYRDSRGTLWVGTNDGLNIYQPETESFQRIYPDGTDNTPPEGIVFSILEDSEGDIWFGSNSSGVAVLDRNTGRYRVYSYDADNPGSLSDNLVRSMLEDSSGRLWLGTNRGLNRFDRETDSFTRYLHDYRDLSSLSDNNIRALAEDSGGSVWIGTTGGLNQYISDLEGFTYLSRREGLVSNFVTGIIENNPFELWISTNRGVSVYNPASEVLRTIDRTNGLFTEELTNGFFHGPGGKVFVGGINGITVIDKPAAEDSGYLPPVALVQLEVMGQPVVHKQNPDGSFPELILTSADRLFSVQFSALDYSAPERNIYAYKLEGFDKDWTQQDKKNSVRYTNLDPGIYTLRIIGAGSRGNWNKAGISLPVRVLPPWWRTLAAKIVYQVLIFTLVLLPFLLLRRRTKRAEARFVKQQMISRELDRKVLDRTREIEDARRVAEEANHAKGLFLANMSHEIRTPLTGLFGMLSMLSGSELSGDQRAYIEQSTIAVKSLNRLVNDLLDFESLQAGSLLVLKAPFQLTAAMEYLNRLFLSLAEEKGLKYTYTANIHDSSDFVLGDESRFIQVVGNLLNNAVKYTDAGTVALRLSDEGQNKYRIDIEDTGIGIPEGLQEKIFESFFQLDTGYTKKTKGVGLGLAIVKQLVQSMGGTIEVQSREGKGTLFSLHMILPPAPVEEAAAGSSPDEAKMPETGCRVLLCEDEAINRLYLRTLLISRGFDVDTAINGQEAVEFAKKGGYCIILMDLSMPKVGGIDASRTIRVFEAENPGSRTPIIALTAHTFPDDIRKCYDAGMDDFVAKPVNEKALFSSLARYINFN